MDKLEQSLKDIKVLMDKITKSKDVNEVNELEPKVMYVVMGVQAVASKLDGELTGVISEQKQVLRQAQFEEAISVAKGDETTEKPVEKPVEKTEKKVSKKKKIA